MTQLGFDDLLKSAAEDNAARMFEQDTEHLPECFEDAVTFYRELVENHDQAMRAADVERVMHLR